MFDLGGLFLGPRGGLSILIPIQQLDVKRAIMFFRFLHCEELTNKSLHHVCHHQSKTMMIM